MLAESLTVYSKVAGIAIQFFGRDRNSVSSLFSIPTASSAILLSHPESVRNPESQFGYRIGYK